MASFAVPALGATVNGTTIINMSTLGAVGAYNGGNWYGARYALWLDETTFLWGFETNPAAISVSFTWNTTKGRGWTPHAQVVRVRRLGSVGDHGGHGHGKESLMPLIRR